MTKIVLASSSPRRSDLLRQIGIRFEVVEHDVDESIYSFEKDPSETAGSLALAKARSAATKGKVRDCLVLGADTTVFVENHMLGKPQDGSDAFTMLKKLTGRSHRVLTGFAILDPGSNRSMVRHEWTKVFMRNCTDEEIREYIETGEPLDKAGSYGANALGATLITRVEGCFYNVIGLPLASLLIALRDFHSPPTD